MDEWRNYIRGDSMLKKIKKYPHAFFERNTWNHRTKKLLPDYTIKYGKKVALKQLKKQKKHIRNI